MSNIAGTIQKSNHGRNPLALGVCLAVALGMFPVHAQSLSFDGLNDFVELGNPTSLRLFGQFTLAAWVKTSVPGWGFRDVITKDSNFNMGIYGDGTLYTYDWNGRQYIPSGVNVADGQWHHVAVVRRPGIYNGSQFFVDGVQKGPSFTVAGNYDSRHNVAIAALSSDIWAGENLKALIRDVRVYGRALAGNEVASLGVCRG